MGGFDPPIPAESDAPSDGYSGVRDELNSYLSILEKYGQNILQGKTPWDKLEQEEVFENARLYINSTMGSDAKSVYDALKATNRVDTLMTFGLKQKYGEDAVYAAMTEIAEEIRSTHDDYRQRLEDAGMEKFADYFSKMGDTLSQLYTESPSAYLFSEGLLRVGEQSKALVESIENTGKKFEQELEKLMNLLESLNERYGELS